MTSQEPHTQHLPDPDFPDTEVILVEQPAPVFVDSTGRRRRVLRRFSYAFGAFCMVYGGLISLSLAGGPVSPDSVIPFPGLIAGASDRAAEAVPTPTAPSPITAPRAVLVNDATARRTAGPPAPVAGTGGHPAPQATTRTPTRIRAARPPAVPTTAGPAATVTGGSRPTEATTTAQPTPAPTPTTASMPNTPVAVPPTPPTAAPNPGGTGGGSPTGTEPDNGPSRADTGVRR